MGHIADFFQLGILLLGLVGLGLLSRRVCPEVPFALHFCLAPVAVATVLFCVEHFLALGQPRWIWPPWTLLSAWLVWQNRFTLPRESVLWYFLIGFGVCFFWRFFFPDIWETSEMLPDLDHLVSYSSGDLLPAHDSFLKDAKDNVYYIFQYYAAGLIHRLFGTSPGLTYHLGYSTLVGFGIAGMGAGVEAATRSWKAGLLAAVGIVLGGNGATFLTPFTDIHNRPSTLAAMRFIGSYAVPNDANAPDHMSRFGTWLLSIIGVSPVDAPMEYYSYIVMLGDFHPSLSSLTLLGLSILAIGTAETALPGSLTDRLCVSAAIGTPILMMISNTWVMPLQAALILCWLVYRWMIGRRDHWTWIVGSFLVIFSLIFPFFLEFAYETTSYNAHLKLVSEHAPILNWLAVMLPAVVLWALAIAPARQMPMARFTVIVGLGAMMCTYVFFINDMYGGVYAIFNTTLKWWPWVYGLIIVLGLISAWPHRGPRYGAIAIITLTIISNCYIFGFYWLTGVHGDHAGRLDGYAWFTQDDNQRTIYEVLKTMPPGVVLESKMPDSADTGASLALFTGHTGTAAWTGHEMLWRDHRPDLDLINANRDKLYLGTLDDPESWLRSVVPGGVTYIVWMNRDNDRGLDIWPGLNASLKHDYDWRATYEYNKARYGFWIKRQ
jgi:hypothetical protein